MVLRIAHLGVIAALMGVLGLAACTRTVERPIVATPTPTQPSPTAEPNLSEEEAIGLVRQRKTTGLIVFPNEQITWKEKESEACLATAGPDEFHKAIENLEAVRAGRKPTHTQFRMQRHEWTAQLDKRHRWTVKLVCHLVDPAAILTAASWTVDDETLRVIPVVGYAD